MTRQITKFLFPLFILLFIQSCTRDQQPFCTVYETEKFIGYYNVSEYCTNSFGHGVSFATINPGNGSNPSEIVLFNFLNSGRNISAYVACDGSYFQIPNQSLGSSAYTVVGEGYYINTSGFEQLQFDVQLNENGLANFCSYTYSK
ncbi:MAG: hypothetical protein H6579_01420 [Chitinophagales bacterium]|nr:hypothetical protein [Chitinophagales bacterium]